MLERPRIRPQRLCGQMCPGWTALQRYYYYYYYYYYHHRRRRRRHHY